MGDGNLRLENLLRGFACHRVSEERTFLIGKTNPAAGPAVSTGQAGEATRLQIFTQRDEGRV